MFSRTTSYPQCNSSSDMKHAQAPLLVGGKAHGKGNTTLVYFQVDQREGWGRRGRGGEGKERRRWVGGLYKERGYNPVIMASYILMVKLTDY